MARGEALELEAGTDQEGEAPELDDGAQESRRGEHRYGGDRERRGSAGADADGEVGRGSGI